MRTDFVLDALERALYAMQPERDGTFVHHSDRGSTKESVELATLERGAWFTYHRLLEPIGCISPADAEANYCMQLANQATTVVA